MDLPICQSMLTRDETWNTGKSDSTPPGTGPAYAQYRKEGIAIKRSLMATRAPPKIDTLVFFYYFLTSIAERTNASDAAPNPADIARMLNAGYLRKRADLCGETKTTTRFSQGAAHSEKIRDPANHGL